MSRVIYHLTIEHIYYLLNYQCYLTLKADGYYCIHDINNYSYECEDINNKKFIFNKLEDNNNIQNKIFNLAEELNITYPKELKYEVNKHNFYEIIGIYLDYYSKLKIKVIPKFYLKICKDNFLDIIKIISNYFPSEGFPNDGWVIVPENEKLIAKIKPANHLTIDLKFRNGKFYSFERNEILVNNNRRLENNSIYRCYWENSNWVAKEVRKDKKNGNNQQIIEVVTNYLVKGYCLESINLNERYDYYEHNKDCKNEFIEYFKFMSNQTKIWISKNINIDDNTNILNIGCGKSSGYKTLVELGLKNIVGIDSDPICILKSTIISKSNNYILLDINYDWTIKDQCDRFGEIWQVSQLYKFRNLFKKFKILLFNFSIFYCEENNYLKIIKNLESVSEIGTKLFFNYFDYNKCSEKLIDDFNIKIEGSNVNIKLPWQSTSHNELLFDNNKFNSLLLNNKWKNISKTYIDTKYEKFNDWQNLIVYEVWEKI